MVMPFFPTAAGPSFAADRSMPCASRSGQIVPFRERGTCRRHFCRLRLNVVHEKELAIEAVSFRLVPFLGGTPSMAKMRLSRGNCPLVRFTQPHARTAAILVDEDDAGRLQRLLNSVQG